MFNLLRKKDRDTSISNEKDIMIIEETESHYLVDIDGNKKKLYKINQDEVKNSYYIAVEKAAESLNRSQIIDILETVESLLNNYPTVDKYEKAANLIASKLESLYKVIGSPNLFHHPIKNITIGIYGRAETFIHQLTLLRDILIDIAKKMEEMGKVDQVTVSKNKMKRYILYTKDLDPIHSLESVPNWYESVVTKFETKIT